MDEATTKLAQMYSGAMHPWADCPAVRHIYEAMRCGAQWRWLDAESHLDAAYKAIGGTNPATGYAWHLGQHPLQAEIERLDPTSGMYG